MTVREDELEQAAQELLDAIASKWDGETQKRRENAISPRMEEAIAALRKLLDE